MTSSEQAIQQETILALAAMPGVKAWRQNTGAMENRNGQLVRFGLPGQSDISGIVGPEGWRIEVEVKRPRGRLTRLQTNWLRMIEQQGGIAMMVRSASEAVDRLQAEIDKRRKERALFG